ncbi:hypothetical protein IPA_06490 [Ignicoccus pacificus DSM 13166]|uniref:Alcohol dehydrogenase-like N-terminal domain-containing protein n=1 Tax=Ignicoccus pacificus DSM 13166 TaxID=940294 RepID=A0A977KCG5_9CREN|nr:hypothetical protein IPA_06490 [Ignicoccus pacificus DSM 13166]
MRAVVFKGDLVIEDRPIPPVPEGHLLVKVERSVVGPLERGLKRGLVWVEPGRVVGMEGYGRVEETGANTNIKKGEIVSSPILVNESDIVGVHVDGFLAEYAIVPESAVEPLPEGRPEHLALAGTGALASWLKEKLEGYRALLIGGGLTNVLTSFLSNWEIPILSWGHEISAPVQLFPTIASACTQEWDTVVVSVLDAMAVDTATMCVKEGGTIILHPLVAYSKHVFAGKQVKVEVMQRNELREGYEAISKLPSQLLRELVEFSDSLDKALDSKASRSILKPPVSGT